MVGYSSRYSGHVQFFVEVPKTILTLAQLGKRGSGGPRALVNCSNRPRSPYGCVNLHVDHSGVNAYQPARLVGLQLNYVHEGSGPAIPGRLRPVEAKRSQKILQRPRYVVPYGTHGRSLRLRSASTRLTVGHVTSLNGRRPFERTPPHWSRGLVDGDGATGGDQSHRSRSRARARPRECRPTRLSPTPSTRVSIATTRPLRQRDPSADQREERQHRQAAIARILEAHRVAADAGASKDSCPPRSRSGTPARRRTRARPDRSACAPRRARRRARHAARRQRRASPYCAARRRRSASRSAGRRRRAARTATSGRRASARRNRPPAR